MSEPSTPARATSLAPGPSVDTTGLRVAAIVPCHNEELAVGKVVRDLVDAVPGIDVYVYDNNSTDKTAEVARDAGAIVRYEHAKGKGNVVRRAFADVDADVYLMIDGDDTYDASAAPRLISTLLEGPYDHVLGVRREVTETAYRPGHATGNRMFNALVSGIFGVEVSDMLSGYRAFSHRFVKSFPAVSREFETETELTVHAATLRVPQTEVEVDFTDRPEGAESKLRTYHDGFKILRLVLHLARVERPVLFHTAVAAVLMLVGLVVGLPAVLDYLRTGLVPRFPSAILAASIELLSFMTFFLGLTLSALKRVKDENMRLVYLSMRPPATVAAPVEGGTPAQSTR
ncbi:glycosyltransferase [Nocardioides pocheonensis]|uniref:Glycosyltransferase n=1 Tax=Nocardioides pocheonensis TaxID=661485 RepID=A0A3N0GNL2_9ACTN|nr:glycosyltransferase [Nocardioides pocheonensis]RNM13806.1 glycosyltransferase [Nocardioides pocheonensis]